MKFTTRSKTQTIALGKKIAKTLKGGEVIALSGELGAGKTTLIQGIAKGLGIKKTVTSPTFLIMRIYSIPKSKRYKLQATSYKLVPKVFVHIDCYRIESAQTIKAIGALEYFGQLDTVVVIEWPEKMKKLLPRQTRRITLVLGREDKRIIDLH